MWALVIAAPLGFMLLTLILAWIEETVVFPVDRAVQITKALERSPADELETAVARMLAPIVPGRRAS
jgi:hypothetical protein